jgi:hypothetical protein
MARCLVSASSSEDKATLVRWIFMALAQNPAISSLTKATDADINKANAAVGALFMRLLTVDCVDKTKLAIKYEGGARRFKPLLVYWARSQSCLRIRRSARSWLA